MILFKYKRYNITITDMQKMPGIWLSDHHNQHIINKNQNILKVKDA